MQNAGLYEAQAGIQIPRKNIKNLRYTDNTTLMVLSEKNFKGYLSKKEGSPAENIREPFRGPVHTRLSVGSTERLGSPGHEG